MKQIALSIRFFLFPVWNVMRRLAEEKKGRKQNTFDASSVNDLQVQTSIAHNSRLCVGVCVLVDAANTWQAKH